MVACQARRQWGTWESQTPDFWSKCRSESLSEVLILHTPGGQPIQLVHKLISSEARLALPSGGRPCVCTVWQRRECASPSGPSRAERPRVVDLAGQPQETSNRGQHRGSEPACCPPRRAPRRVLLDQPVPFCTGQRCALHRSGVAVPEHYRHDVGAICNTPVGTRSRSALQATAFTRKSKLSHF